MYIYSSHGQSYVKWQYDVYPRLGINVLTNTFEPTIYYVTMVNNLYKNGSIMTYSAMNQDKGTVLFPFFSLPVDLNTLQFDVTDFYMNWQDYYIFNGNTGQPELLLELNSPTHDLQASFGMDIYTTIYAVSDFLRTMLQGPKQRLYVFFRTTTGLLIGASHGKFFSNSDVDYSKNNPLLNPPPVSEFKKFTPTDSTDPTIQSSAVWLLSQYQGWDTIPDLNVVQSLVGEDYWITTQHISSAVCFRYFFEFTFLFFEKRVGGVIPNPDFCYGKLFNRYPSK